MKEILNLMLTRVNALYLLIMVLTLSAFTHLWNPTGFPDLFFDEGVYMRRTMHVLSGLGPQEAWFHDHPFFGQIFLAGTLAITGYPQSLHPTADVNSMSMLYLAPRIIMGLLAVIDTFLIFKIAENRYDKNIAVVASILFAVMPITWFLRRILLDSILLPFLLASILLALYSKDAKNKNVIVLFSGVLLGLAIFTKMPAFTIIPLVAWLIYTHNGKSLKTLALWFLPVFLIPLLWPIQSIFAGQFDLWMKDVLWQTHRSGVGLSMIADTFVRIDPVLFILSLAGIAFAAIRKNFFILIWVLPFVAFLALIEYVQYFYSIMLLPVFCIASAVFIMSLCKKINREKLQKILPIVVVAGIGIFGLTSTVMLITNDVSKSEFQTMAFVLQHVKNDTDTTILSSPTYSWVFDYVFHQDNVRIDYSDILFGPVKTKHVLLVADPHFLIDIGRGKQLSDLYDTTSTIATFDENMSKYDISKYPYTSMAQNYEGNHIEVKIK